MTKITIRLVDERQSRRRSFKRALIGIIGIPAILFGPGLIADSAAMQWAGFVMFITLIAIAATIWDDERMTIKEARRKLDKMEAGDE